MTGMEVTAATGFCTVGTVKWCLLHIESLVGYSVITRGLCLCMVKVSLSSMQKKKKTVPWHIW